MNNDEAAAARKELERYQALLLEQTDPKVRQMLSELIAELNRRLENRD